MKNFQHTAKLREFYSETVEQFSRGGGGPIVLPRGHLVKSEDILGGHNGGGFWHLTAGVQGAAPLTKCTGHPTTKNPLVQTVQC